MTETERLRELLDERGAEWRRTPHYSSESVDNETVFRGEGIEWIANGHLNGHIGLRALRYEVTPEQAVEATLGARITGDTSDGYHTFNELYHHRAVLFSVIVRDHRELAWKSKLHHDGTMYDGMFIVGIETPNGQATYHYDVDPYWDMFDCRELDRAPEWDGHTPSEAIERISTLGRKPWINPAWERWRRSLRHDEIKSVGDAVEQLMYEAIEFGGDMGPNGNTYNGIDEGDVLTAGFINEWVARFESTLGRDRYSYEQWREISNAVGDAMEYAHVRAIEHPDAADPLWNLDEYVNRILKVAFEGEATLGRGTCRMELAELRGPAYTDIYECSECGEEVMVGTVMGESEPPKWCPNCGRRVLSE